jgi:eukaryotic-like serine/threonine-protein kinase
MPPVPSTETAPVREGDILDGKYQVEKILGVGGMGVVVAATHVQLQTRVALKFLLPDVLDSPQVVQRFAREARAAVQIQSEHVARVIDVGTLPTGSPYMVMEYLEGGDLSQTVAQAGALPVAKAVGYVLQACEAIAEAHALGMVHRDLKPANLFLARRAGRDSIVKVLDFGISKSNETGSSGLTQTSNVMGSPQYMSPEQMMSSKNVDARADIWALGVILYELLTGAPPFVAETMAEIVYMVTQREAPSLAEKRPDLPPALGTLIARALSRDPAWRFADVAKLAAALAPFGPPRSEISVERIARVLGQHEATGSEPHAAPPPSAATSNPVALAATSMPPAPRTTAATTAPEPDVGEDQPPRSKGRVLFLAAAALGLVAIVGWRAMRGTTETPPARPAESVAAPPAAAPPAAAPSAAAPPAAAPPIAPPATAPPAPQPSPVAPPVNAAAPVEQGSEKPARTPPHPAHVASKHGKPHVAATAAVPAGSAHALEPPPQPASRGLNMGMKE